MIHHGDCRDVMRTLDANSVDAVVTDPPYGLSFMGKDWDHGIPGVEFWKAAFRVMKPGAFLLSFGGTRTFHRLTCAIEDAGLEIRDCLMWLYGSGFPKSHDVSKAIDKAAGAEREVIGEGVHGKGSYSQGMSKESGFRPYTAGLPSENNGGVHEITAPATDAAKQWSGWGTALKPAWEPIIVAHKPLEGTVAENVQKWGTGGMNIDGGRIPGIVPQTVHGVSSRQGEVYGKYRDDPQPSTVNKGGRWPANLILDEEAGIMLDEQSLANGMHGAGKKRDSGQVKHGENSSLFGINGHESNGMRFGDSGGASRFFYCAKASRRERGEGNNHPTVKPQSLLEYLIRLVCPPNGLILDPFCGSGSTGVAAKNLGMHFIGIEKEAQYVGIAKARIDATERPLVAA